FCQTVGHDRAAEAGANDDRVEMGHDYSVKREEVKQLRRKISMRSRDRPEPDRGAERAGHARSARRHLADAETRLGNCPPKLDGAVPETALKASKSNRLRPAIVSCSWVVGSRGSTW